MSSAPPPANTASVVPHAANGSRDYDSGAPSFDALLRQLRLEVARVLQLPPDSRAKEEPALVSLANHTYTGDERCTNCIARNNPTCVVNSSRQRCDSCFLKRHRCSKVPTPPTRPARESNAHANAGAAAAAGNAKSASTSKGKAAGDAPTTANGESASARSQKRKRPADVEDTKRPEPAAKRPTRPTRPTAAATAAPAAGTSTSASAPVTRLPAQKREKPPIQNGVASAAGAGASASASTNPLNALAASASRAPRAPAVPVTSNAHAHTPQQQQARLQQYQEKLQVVAGILQMVQNAVKELQDQITVDMSATR
ncbi:hypothetical protein FKP32DRAFT_1603270 [Trametes sanguinea]|nr:hypothetical protein FKP32DRAFT_1603270 [Trametes sanguinea]